MTGHVNNIVTLILLIKASSGFPRIKPQHFLPLRALIFPVDSGAPGFISHAIFK